MNDNGIVLIDSTTTSLSISWPEIPEAQRYILQYRGASKAGDENPNNKESHTTLSEKLTTTQAKKNNLLHTDGPFQFRVRAITTNEKTRNDNGESFDDWIKNKDSFQVLSEEEEKLRMPQAPKLVSEGNNSILVRWNAYSDTSLSGYELQMREDSSGAGWVTIAPRIKNTEVRKRNLKSGMRYQFRVRPVLSSVEKSEVYIAFSPVSDAVLVSVLSVGMERVFGGLPQNRLLVSQGSSTSGGRTTSLIPLSEALGGKIVLLYASAHWCPPCRQFTPNLAKFYNANRADVEIVFLSCDHDEGAFDSYFATMPWKAVPYECDLREKLMAWIKVTGIPRLVVLNASGGILESNAVGKQMDVIKWKQGQR